MNVRLVAYRKATTTATSDSTYQLDLQEAPNISLNFQFSDIKEPETRKGSYSQTFKLPFTKNNNQFFQEWYNVNLENLVFSTRKTFDAVLFVGTVPQFEGALQLKAVYQKAQCYEVVLMSNTSSLFSTIGEKKLKDVFKNDNGSYSTDFNHTYNETNLAASWSNTLQNTSGDSLYDSDISVSKIVYPISVTEPNFFFNENEQFYMNMNSTQVSNLGFDVASQYIASLTQFRPAIQLRTLFKLILAKAGFSYTSNFIDGTGDYSSEKYFGKLFMTTGNFLEAKGLPISNTNALTSGLMIIGETGTWGSVNKYDEDVVELDEFQEVLDLSLTTPYTDYTYPTDADGLWNTTYNYFTKSDANIDSIEIQHKVSISNVEPASYFSNYGIPIAYRVRFFDTATNTPTDVEYSSNIFILSEAANYTTASFGTTTIVLDISNMPVGASAQIIISPFGWKWNGSGSSGNVVLGSSSTPATGVFTGLATMTWAGYATSIYGGTVDVPSCIDASITQREFLKDIIQRFNLVVVTDPEDASNLIIEPYKDYIGDGEIKDWTNKLDTSKEVIVKDTTELQKRSINFSDQEDEDLYNKIFKERVPKANVYGHIKITETGNDFAKGELKNDAIFSPFINGMVYRNENTQSLTSLKNMAVQYEFSYEQSDSQVTNPIKATKPKLFYYNGSPTTVLDSTGATKTYYLHNLNNATTTITTFAFTTYPVCTPYDINPSSNVATLNSSTKSLYWNSTAPVVGELDIFNYSGSTGNWFNNSLYGLYWKDYLNNRYSDNARIMECYLNLNEVDIFNFKFNDEIFIKDSYYNILNISNYQVNGKTSTKLTLLKSLDTKENCFDCDYVIGETPQGQNMVTAGLGDLDAYIWCPDDDPDCTPILSGTAEGVYTSPECCNCNGGMVQYQYTDFASSGLYPCFAYASSLPLSVSSQQNLFSPTSKGQLKSVIENVFGSRNTPFIVGAANNKYNNEIIPKYNDDIVIKYQTGRSDVPQLKGESHRIILTGNTVGNTTSYAYSQGNANEEPLQMKDNINMIIRVKGTATVIGGTSSTYTLGYTEGFAYYTAFKIIGSSATQLSTLGGQQEFSIREGANPTTCTLYIDMSGGLLRFGLKDSQTDTKRIWALTADIDVNIINNMTLGYDENWALFQNSKKIKFQNGDYLIWN